MHLRPCLPFALAILAACNGSAVVAPPETALYANPVVTPVAADPSVIRADDGTYYLFATQDNWADGADDHLLPVFRSEDLVAWTFVGDAFTEAPAWKDDGFLWAPDISRCGDGYCLYYSYSIWDDPNPCIGLATAAHPEGPWADLGRPVFCSDSIGVEGSIDPFVWDEGGRRMMIWGSFNGIYAVALSPDGTAPEGEKTMLADSRFEAAFVHRREGFYYLFVSAGSCCEGAESTYEVWVGRSASLTGPYLDEAGEDLREDGGRLVLSENTTWLGPGHTAVVADSEGADWLFYHALPRADPLLADGTNRRPTLLDRIAWVGGWPVVNSGQGPSTTQREAPALD